MVFIVVAVFGSVGLMFAALLAPSFFAKQELTPTNVALGFLACLLITLCTWLILTP